MTDKEKVWDKRFQIKTAEWDEVNASGYRFRYEPTPYCVLERLSESGFIRRGDTVVDYGCGKGRVGFFLSAQTGADTIGIEYDERIYRDALENRKTARGCRQSFVHTGAEIWEVPTEVNRCYFFNPFSVEILQKVMAKIICSYYENPRRILLFFYYPSDEYISYLMTVKEIEHFGEISCTDLFGDESPRERILIFSLE